MKNKTSEKKERLLKSQFFETRKDHNGNMAISHNTENLLKFIEEDVIGRDVLFEGPFGSRKILYCDYVASGKALNSIEQFMQKQVLPLYANTHTTTTMTASQTTAFRKEAKDIIRQALGTNDDDVVIFTGSGVTGAVHKLISVLDLPMPPVVFCGPFEHHSNLLPWREMDSHDVNISETEGGKVNLRHLEVALRAWSNSGRPLIGTFSAASNITGITTDTRKVSALLHKYGAISLWDYATGGPYMDIQMHPKPIGDVDTSKDAVFISMHKFVGSPDAPGLLVASKKLFKNSVPSGCGGGTVLYVSENDHRYLKDIESREEGGTPAIIGSIRAGLAFKLKMTVETETIMQREDELYKRAMEVWKDVPELEILGILENDSIRDEEGHKLAVFSFLIRHLESGYYLHYNFVTALLNDFFGIQTRGGCACAGVYAQHLLGINKVAEKRFGEALVEDPKRAKTRAPHETERTVNEILRPGFTRLNLAYFISDEDADFVISAVAMVAKHGWTLLPQYKYAPRSGEWKHTDHNEELIIKRLADLTFHDNGLYFNDDLHKSSSKDQIRRSAIGMPTSRIDCLKKAERIFFNAKKVVGKDDTDQRSDFTHANVKNLRWFLLPFEAQTILKGKKIEKKTKLIFEVRTSIRQLSEDEIKENVTAGMNAKLMGESMTNGNMISGEMVHQHDVNVKISSDRKMKKAKKSLLSVLTCKSKKSVEVIS